MQTALSIRAAGTNHLEGSELVLSLGALRLGRVRMVYVHRRLRLTHTRRAAKSD